ncbi:MAG: hypothetical protein RMJ66_05940 [Bacteroidia bacterium]|nr:hypothetical protein [Bacteroidia bacterium]MDW8134591.1 hypothetical protein [Bacteroidia bacterium]
MKIIFAFLVLGNIIAWVFSIALYRRLRGILLKWEKPVFGLWTALLFSIGLLMLSGGMLSYALSIKYGASSTIANLWQDISTLCFASVAVVGLLYWGLRYQFLQPISEEGFYKIEFDWNRLSWKVELIPWEKIYDYYFHTEEALTTFTLLLRNRREVSFQVPIHLREIIERIIDFSTDKHNLFHSQSQRITRSSGT